MDVEGKVNSAQVLANDTMLAALSKKKELRTEIIRRGDKVTASKHSTVKAWGEVEKERATIKELEEKLERLETEAYDQYIAGFD